jgi:hypothetical protein
LFVLLACIAVPRDGHAVRFVRARQIARSPHTIVPRARRVRRARMTRRPPGHPLGRHATVRPAEAAPRSKVWHPTGTMKHITGELTPNRRVSDLSTMALTAAGAPGVGGAHTISLPPFLDVFTGVGGLALTAASIVDYRRALDGPGRADAAHGLAWGLQSLTAMTAHVARVPVLGAVSQWLGVGGGVLQSGLGLYRLKDGLARRDRRVTILGALDVVAGVSWVASTVSWNPVALGVFLGSTGVRTVYANAGLLRQKADHLMQSARARLRVSNRPTEAAAGSAAE